MTKYKLIFILFLVLTVSACTLGSDFTPPQVTPPDTYSLDTKKATSLINLPWWELYQDPVLKNLIQESISNNKEIQIILARIEEAAALMGIARADLYPQLDLSSRVAKTEYNNSIRNSSSNESYNVAVVPYWNLDLFGRYRRANEAAKAEMLSSEYLYQAALTALVANVARAYFQLLDLDNQLNIAKRTHLSRKESQSIIKSRFDKGYVAEIDFLQATIELEQAASTIHSLTRSLKQQENALNLLLGRSPQKIDVTNDLYNIKLKADIPIGLPSELLKRRPDIQAALAALHAQTARVGVAEAMRFPSLSLTGVLGVDSLDLNEFNLNQDRFWSFSVDVLGPILSANRNIRRVELEEARVKQLAANYYQVVLNAFKDVEDSLIAIKTTKLEYQSRTNQVKAGKLAADLSRARYDSGVTSYLELLDIERTLFEAELLQSQALTNNLISTVDLYWHLGGGWELLEKEPLKNSVK